MHVKTFYIREDNIAEMIIITQRYSREPYNETSWTNTSIHYYLRSRRGERKWSAALSPRRERAVLLFVKRKLAIKSAVFTFESFTRVSDRHVFVSKRARAWFIYRSISRARTSLVDLSFFYAALRILRMQARSCDDKGLIVTIFARCRGSKDHLIKYGGSGIISRRREKGGEFGELGRFYKFLIQLSGI